MGEAAAAVSAMTPREESNGELLLNTQESNKDRDLHLPLRKRHRFGTWNVRSMFSGKQLIIDKEMTRYNIEILGISEQTGQEWVTS